RPSLVPAGVGLLVLVLSRFLAEDLLLPAVRTWQVSVSGLVAAALLTPDMLMGRGIGMVAGFVILWGLGWLYQRLRSRQGLGGGDPFLFGAGGAWVGWIGLPSVLLWGSAAGLSLVLARLILRRPVAMTDRLPFGTFLAAGVWLVWLYGPLGL
ncbi:MAG: prepilin peptidase, partial [Brevundimonas sp.]|uniref:prepilin peptidase n=1 Tax=Brevundimonas sp. TaxID=1871086 RepID=UPI00391DF481